MRCSATLAGQGSRALFVAAVFFALTLPAGCFRLTAEDSFFAVAGLSFRFFGLASLVRCVATGWSRPKSVWGD